LTERPTAAQTTSTIEGVVTDRQGLAIPGAEVSIAGNSFAVSKKTTTNGGGAYEVAALPAGTYTLTISHSGFSTHVINDLEITLNRTIKTNVTLEVGTVQLRVDVSGEIALLETSSSSEGSTIVPQQIEQMPLNGRNYLDLMQLVPGVAINRQADLNDDNAKPVLGERANNTGLVGFKKDSSGNWQFQTDYPFFIFQRVGFFEGKPFNFGILIFGLAVVLLTVLLWPVGAMIRKHYGRPLELNPDERRQRLLARLVCLLFLAVSIG
jgi:hypothetical protein